MFRDHFLTHSMKINKSTISLNGLEFNSKIGLLDYEKENGNTFIVNISVEVEVDKINYDDSVEGTVDYSEIFSIIKLEMSRECNLLETVAYKISSRIHKEINSIKLCRIEIIKNRPPLEGHVDNSSFILETTS